jgi:release factor glutamine methyltransferase
MMSRLRNFIKSISKPFLSKGLEWYYRKPRKYRYQGIEVMVDPSVFPPQLTLSTKILLNFISELDIKNKTFLELGCGSGIISLYARKKGAKVTATDINEMALKNLREAAYKNDLELEVIHSDLFDQLSDRSFDHIIINPPYYPKDPKNIKEMAWFCGADFEYFKRLFSQLPKFLSEANQTFIILSEDCDLQRIDKNARENRITLKEVQRIKKLGEINYIYSTNR